MQNNVAFRGGCILSRAIIFSFFVSLALISANLLSPHATFANKYYIDCAEGADSNDGTSSSTPWKHAPGMTGFSGTYKHAAGDQIIFKGGVTCPVSYFPMTIANSGTSGNYDYYGVDQTWYAGSSWTLPLFDMNYKAVTGLIPVYITGSYVTIDNIEIAHMQNGSSGSYNGSVTTGTSATHVTIQNCHIHDWRSGQLQSATGDNGGGGISFLNGGVKGTQYYLVANNNTIGPGQGGDGTTNYCSGMGVWGGDTVTNNTITNACDEIHGGEKIIAGNTFTWGNHPWVTLNHNNLIWWAAGGTNSYWYNNLVVGPFSGEYEGFFPHPCWGGVNSVVYIFNNILQNNGQMPIQPDNSGCTTGNSNGVYVLNNTCGNTQASPGQPCGSVDDHGTPMSFLTIQNNHWITNSYMGDSWYNTTGVNAFTYDSSNVKYQTSAQSAAQGYALGTEWAPTGPYLKGCTVSSTNCSVTIQYGTNLTSMCTGGTINNLCKDRLGNNRPANGAWDAGAYEWGTSSSNAPDPPSGLVATVQ